MYFASKLLLCVLILLLVLFLYDLPIPQPMPIPCAFPLIFNARLMRPTTVYCDVAARPPIATAVFRPPAVRASVSLILIHPLCNILNYLPAMLFLVVKQCDIVMFTCMHCKSIVIRGLSYSYENRNCVVMKFGVNN